MNFTGIIHLNKLSPFANGRSGNVEVKIQNLDSGKHSVSLEVASLLIQIVYFEFSLFDWKIFRCGLRW